MGTDKDQEILNVLKYNQVRMNKLKENQQKRKDELDQAIGRSNVTSNQINDNLSRSMNVLKKYGVEVKRSSIHATIPEEEGALHNNVKSGPSTSWEDLVREAGQAGFSEVTIEDILTKEEVDRADDRYDQIAKEFKEKVKLDKVDIAFLLLATALQCARQYILSSDKFRFKTADEADKVIKGRLKKRVPKEWHEILLGSVPYDAVSRLDPSSESTGISANTHRYRTLGHDPIMGWIFGPVNILSDSLTKSDFITTYEIINHKIANRYEKGTLGAIHTAIEVAQENNYNLPAAIMKQAIHVGTDYFTQQGLPVPFISSIDNDLSKTLINKFGINSYSITAGASLSIFINEIIKLTHKLFYDEKKYGSPDMYEVKTRKILMLSNSIATSSNVIYVALSKDLKKLDAGGMLVTLYRLVSDTQFISKVKEEFIHSKLEEELQQELDRIDQLLSKFNG
ncbi:hypothetical protein JCM9140_3934 [Halalkalibacter wakoensis JCM 9140]|uniref:Uncharacterized protein n=1 Tax=Halalkalibacter wakoensis JCM 9140 TaxID=1236970 RepID=W4Q733_9BACI|nr:hypothetical protein [Halalkalibacter wakoensis]GAE27775.1 hypothetical protein JCM9140_3934 [Halalkalibacter wakoensis JCM 9140]